MAAFERPQTRSPLRRKPLRNPGESIQGEMDRLISESFMPLLFVAVFAVLLAFFEWWRSFYDIKPQPATFTLVAIGAVVYTTRRFYQVRAQVRHLRQGLEGEKAVAQYLDDHRHPGYRLFHDVPGDGFNVDHVMVGPGGIFAIETKAFSKPGRGEAVVDYDGSRLKFNGREPDRNPVVQAQASASWLRELLEESTSRQFKIRPVVLLPGWYVNSTKGAQSEIWVLNPKAFPTFVEGSPSSLSDKDVALVASRLVNYVAREAGSS